MGAAPRHRLGSFEVSRLRVTHDDWPGGGKGNALGLAGDGRETLLAPVTLCLLDALGRAVDKVPPDVSRAFERRAAEQHQPRWTSRRAPQQNLRARSEDEELPGHVHCTLGEEFDRAFDDVGRALLLFD